MVCFFVVLAALAIFVFGPLENDGPPGRVDGPVLVGAPVDDHMLAEVSGAVTYDGRCLRLDGASILWPPGTRWDGRGVVLDDGTLVAPGDRIEGGGGWLQSVHHLAGDEVGALARACSDADGQIAVLHTVARLAPA